MLSLLPQSGLSSVSQHRQPDTLDTIPSRPTSTKPVPCVSCLESRAASAAIDLELNPTSIRVLLDLNHPIFMPFVSF